MSGETSYPYLVVRLFAACYRRIPIQIRVGPAEMTVNHRRCSLQYPAPFDGHGALTPEFRTLITLEAQGAARHYGFRICIVWSETWCTYVEMDSIDEREDPPSGGLLPSNQRREMSLQDSHDPSALLH